MLNCHPSSVSRSPRGAKVTSLVMGAIAALEPMVSQLFCLAKQGPGQSAWDRPTAKDGTLSHDEILSLPRMHDKVLFICSHMAQGSAICALAQSRRVSCQCRLVCKRSDSTYVKILLFSLTIIFSLYCASSFDVLTSSGEICFGLWYHFHSYLGCFHQLCSRLAS